MKGRKIANALACGCEAVILGRVLISDAPIAVKMVIAVVVGTLILATYAVLSGEQRE